MTTETARATVLALIAAVTGCAFADLARRVERYGGSTMGTSFDIIVEVGFATEDSVDLGRPIQFELAAVERVMSTYDAVSVVSRFGDHPGTEPVRVDPLLLEVLVPALEVAERSGGAFDPTVGPLVDAWGFGPVDRPPPDSAELTALRERVGHEKLVADVAAGTLAQADPGVRVDLSGIAKGFAAERIATSIRELGYESALVDVGGEIRALGSHVDGRPWRVALEGPGPGGPAPVGTVDLVDEAVATSGDFRNSYEIDGVVYAHIVDPRTGYPLRYRGIAVSVVHADAALADAWATALAVLGPDEGYELASREGLAAVFTWLTEEGAQTRATPRLEGRIAPLE